MSFALLFTNSKSLSKLGGRTSERIQELLSPDELLVITVNTRIPYYFDIPLILGYPNSFYQRFRFKNKWISDSLKDHSFTLGMKGLIVLRDMKKNLHVPIRYFEIHSHRIVDNIHFFNVKLLDIVDLGPPTDRQQKLQDFSIKLGQTLPPVINGTAQHPFVYKIDWHKPILQTSYDGNTIESNWGFIVNTLIYKSQYADVPFLKLIETKGKGYSNATYITDCIDTSKGHFKLTPDKTYYFDILQKIEYSDENKKKLEELDDQDLSSISSETKMQLAFSIPFRINLISTTEKVLIPSSEKIAVGEYDILRYFLKVNSLSQSEDGILELKSNRDKDGVYCQPHLLPVSLKASNTGKILRVILFIVATICASLDDIIQLTDPKANINNSIYKFISATGWIGIIIIVGLLTSKVDIFDFFKPKK